MTATGRGSTRTGRPAALPGPDYQPPPAVRADAGCLAVDFHGEDGRRGRFEVSSLPLPGWHAAIAEAFAARVGPTGGVRTLASARCAWDAQRRLFAFLAELAEVPAHPAQLTAGQVEAFFEHRAATAGRSHAWQDVRAAGRLLELPPLREMVGHDVLDFLARPSERRQPAGKAGYSDGELARLLAAARRDAAATRDRIAATEALLARFRDDPAALDDGQHAHAEALATMAASGEVPRLPGCGRREWPERTARAGQLFLTSHDLPPLMVLLVALTGRNIETVKELPAEHRVLEGRAVELRVVKRRRGPHRWFDTATWEIGPPGRELHTPGGVYLLVHRLTTRSRGFSGTAGLWATWRNGHRAKVTGTGEHHDPFARTLHTPAAQIRWVTGHGLHADSDPDGTQDTPPPLALDFNRLKTSIDVRRTRQLGGHLPSAARTNTIPVLFRHYLRGDPTTLAWAHEVVGEAFADAEQAALSAHRRVLDAAGGALHVVPGPATGGELERAGLDAEVARHAADGRLDTAWSACTDPARHPASGRRCEASFLDCFHCGNCLVTTSHLPRLLGLLDALAERRRQMGEQDWWRRYGPAWAAIRHDVLARFSPAELAAAQQAKPADTLLDLVENPWEHP